MNFIQQMDTVEQLPGGRLSIDPNQWDLLPKKPFDRTYLDKYNSLNCKPDIEKVVKLTAKHVTNVMAAWQCYKRHFGVYSSHVNDTSFIVYAPNKRMWAFLRHMTKWKVMQDPKDLPEYGPYFYFGINPSRGEMMSLVEGNNLQGHIVVGASFDLVSTCIWACHNSYQDDKILGPNKTVTWA